MFIRALGAIEKRNAETVFLETLDQATAAGRHVSESRNAGNYAPRILAAGCGFKQGDFEGPLNTTMWWCSAYTIYRDEPALRGGGSSSFPNHLHQREPEVDVNA